MALRVSHAPLRLATGAFIVNSGVAKLRTEDEETFKQYHDFASNAYPQFESMKPKDFTRLLGGAELSLGVALLNPFVSPALAGAGLATFASGLLGLYLRTPGMREGGGIRPSERGIPIAKDSWLLAIGLALVVDGLIGPRRRRRKKSR